MDRLTRGLVMCASNAELLDQWSLVADMLLRCNDWQCLFASRAWLTTTLALGLLITFSMFSD